MPSQIGVLARHLGLTIKDLFKNYLRIDAVVLKEGKKSEGIYILAPAMIEAGIIYDPLERGTCVWLRMDYVLFMR